MNKVILPVFLLLITCLLKAESYPVEGTTLQVPVYRLDKSVNAVILNMGYASSRIQNPEIWEGDHKIPISVDIVFTAYPHKKEDWIIDYNLLLKRRIEAVLKLDPVFTKRTAIKWNFILQTDCDTEEKAKRMFHGAVIKYVNTAPKTTVKKEGEQTIESIADIYSEIETGVYGFSSFEDSAVLKALSRNDWGKMLVVCDWTGSMYPYGSQIVLWHRLNFEKDLIKYFIFFNDGNHKADRQKRIGNTGGIYYSRPDSLEYLVSVMKFVAKRGTGGDIPENNIEALLKGIRLFKGYDQLVMIADNSAGVRDMILLPKVSVPVRIILCGVNPGQPIHPHYLDIARQTGGSIHTMEADIHDLNLLKEGEKIIIGANEYMVKRGKIVFRRKISSP